MRVSLATRWLLTFLLAAAGLAAGLHWPVPWGYWLLYGLLAAHAFLHRPIRAMLRRRRFLQHARKATPGEGAERHRLISATMAMRAGSEERALGLLRKDFETEETRRYARQLAAMALFRLVRRTRRPPDERLCRFPNLTMVALLHSCGRVRRSAIVREAATVGPKDADAIAQQYLDLMDALIETLGDASSAFHDEARDMLQDATDRANLSQLWDDLDAWWKRVRIRLARGGGALLIGMRLVGRGQADVASEMLRRLGSGGLLSREAETVLSASSFLCFLARSPGRLTPEDIPRYFREGHYHACIEMGVLRYPAAGMPQVVECCRRASDHHRAKCRLIEDIMDLWGLFPDEAAAVAWVQALRRLMALSGRLPSPRLAFWKAHWAAIRGSFERQTLRLMEGIVATSDGRYERAAELFRAVAEEEKLAAPEVNLVYVLIRAGKKAEARALGADVAARHGKDPGVLVSLGRMFAMHFADLATAEQFFRQALAIPGSHADPLLCLGEVKMMEGRHSDALDYFRRAAEQETIVPEAHIGRARAFLELHRPDQALDSLRKAEEIASGEAMHFVHYLMYRAYRETGQDHQAIRYLERVPASFFKEPDVLDDIAVHLEAEKLYERAREFAERAMILRARGRGSRPSGPDDGPLL